MRNKILFLMVFVLAAAGFSSCDDESTAGYTRITYYPTLEVLGESELIVAKGEAYVDAGAYAELNGEDVTSQVIVESNVNTSVGGVYSVSYKITNEDGFFVTGSRTVYVVDQTPSIITSGSHTIASGTHRINLNSDARTDFSGYTITILQVEPGVFYISDFMGGYYDQRAGYGSNYAMTGYFQLNADNTITPTSSYVAGWGDSMDVMTTSSVDPSTGQISYSLEYAGFLEFNVIIN